jgi:hypothetical protein
VLKQYAAAGVRERLREIQAEIDMLHREFPELVANHDGIVPAVYPFEKKVVKTSNGHARGPGAGKKRYEQIKPIARKMKIITSPELAKAVGFQSTNASLQYINRMKADGLIEKMEREPGRGQPDKYRWVGK